MTKPNPLPQRIRRSIFKSLRHHLRKSYFVDPDFDVEVRGNESGNLITVKCFERGRARTEQNAITVVQVLIAGGDHETATSH